jgi:hypothetical protein
MMMTAEVKKYWIVTLSSSSAPLSPFESYNNEHHEALGAPVLPPLPMFEKPKALTTIVRKPSHVSKTMMTSLALRLTLTILCLSQTISYCNKTLISHTMRMSMVNLLTSTRTKYLL